LISGLIPRLRPINQRLLNKWVLRKSVGARVGRIQNFTEIFAGILEYAQIEGRRPFGAGSNLAQTWLKLWGDRKDFRMNPTTLIFILVVGGLIAFGVWQDHKSREGIPADLLRAAKGNKKLAKRLLESARLRHPGKSDRWYQEKVLYDLERDGAGSSARRGRRSFGTMTNREKLENLAIISLALSLFSTVFSMISRIFGGDRWN
jgi:hypothetical protein